MLIGNCIARAAIHDMTPAQMNRLANAEPHIVRTCGCHADVTVFGHVYCPLAAPDRPWHPPIAWAEETSNPWVPLSFMTAPSEEIT